MNKFDSKDEKDGFEELDGIIKSIKQYPSSKMEEQLASIQNRVDRLAKFNRIEGNDEENRKKTIFYPIKMIQTMHKDVEEEYSKSHPFNDLGTKTGVLFKIYTMNEKLIELEKGNEDDE